MTPNYSTSSIDKAYETFQSIREQSKDTDRRNAPVFNQTIGKLRLNEASSINTMPLVMKEDESIKIKTRV